ncbi:helix-turn-helix domain-containing protein [Streptomyces sp. WI04-05B]|nr:helix-turn-helix domain-containing protein [Streptomyces sp. WI04-05B]MDX2548763.1 helix-turn-helix domain-containing protein [Streptomyces sp. WI04-05B]MDX2590587.1 helix-turn-helix domain-containing protein [Streptomyces sp. WI04-05A]
MGRREGALDPEAGPVQRFAFALRTLRQEAGGLTYRTMAERAGYSVATLSRAAAGEQLPSLDVALAYARACGADGAEWEWRWRTAAEEAAAVRRTDEDMQAPYRGLARFEAVDAGVYFGRDELVAQLVERMRTRRLVALVGASGSGKSSLLRAGLIPALQREEPLDRRPTGIRILTPGAQPMSVHATAITPSPGRGDTVVILDQFEELFTLCSDRAQRSAFLDRLVTATEPMSGLRVVIAVRADFFGHCAEHHQLAAALRDSALLVDPMGPAELRDAIVKPATAEGLIVERELTAKIIEDVNERPGGLPLMSHALLETWRRRRGRALTLAAYQAVGGVEGAIARTAEDLYARLSAPEARHARRFLLRLIAPGEGTQDTRRPAHREELDAESSPVAADVLELLVKARLITVDGGTVDLAHEALISAWPRLRGWVDAARERIHLQHQLREAARAWNSLGRDPGALYRGARLAAAEEAFADPGTAEDLNGLERDFLFSSTTARDRERFVAARTTRRLRRFSATLSVLLVVALTASAVAWKQYGVSEHRRDEALTAQKTAVSRQLAAQSAALLGDDPDLAMLLAVQAYQTRPTAEAVSTLYSAAALPLRHRLTGSDAPVSAVAFSSDGRSVAAGSSHGQVRMWNTATGSLRTVYPAFAGGVTGLAYRPDDRLLAVGDAHGMLHMGNVAVARKVWTVKDHASDPGPAAVSSDGSSVAAGGSDGRVRLWNTKTGTVRDAFSVSPPGVTSIAFSPDGHLLAVGDSGGTVRLRDLVHGTTRVIRREEAGSVSSMAFSPDSRLLAVGGVDALVQLSDVTTGDLRTRFAGHDGPVRALAFSPDGRLVATGGDDRTVRLWEAATGTSRAVLTGHLDSVLSMAFSADGSTLATGSRDRTVRLWDLARQTPDSRRTGSASLSSIAFAEDGRTFATGDVRGTARFWDTAGERPRGTRTVGVGTVSSLIRRPSGQTMAALITGDGRSVQVWDARTRMLRTVVRRRPPSDTLLATALSPDGRVLVTGGTGARMRLWDVATGRSRAVFDRQTDVVVSLAFSPDGQILASAGADGKVQTWNLATGARHAVLTDLASSLAFSPDGRTLLAGHADGTVRVWDLATRTVRATLSGPRHAVYALAVSPDGHTLAAGNSDGTIQRWKLALPRPLQAIDMICDAVLRDLTQEERSRYLRDPTSTSTWGSPECAHGAEGRGGLAP